MISSLLDRTVITSLARRCTPVDECLGSTTSISMNGSVWCQNYTSTAGNMIDSLGNVMVLPTRHLLQPAYFVVMGIAFLHDFNMNAGGMRPD